MKKLSLLLLLLPLMLVLPTSVHAQMMRNFATPTSNTQTQTAQDEAAGRAVWDKLQSKQVSCGGLKDADFDVLGDFFMGNMMGLNHDSMNQQMSQRLGDEGEKQMHIALGKRLSGCDANATFPQGAGYFAPMMGFSGTGMMGTGTNVLNGNTNSWAESPARMLGFRQGSVMGNGVKLIGVLTWIALLSFLVSGSIFFWKESHKKK